MDPELVSFQLPARLFDRIKELAEHDNMDPIDFIDRLVKTAQSQQSWLTDLTSLREQVELDGLANKGISGHNLVKRMREFRQDIFEAEYAHLYR